ncbi:MAG: YidC/Oxa1 family membrane protein insertase, partial [Oscillospiraceae bacterium]|nr:YidC/Oxa1 family membrane protein insertase [Oscillospiraceae bacterium]
IQQKEGVSQLAGCLPMLIQFPLLFGLMQAIYKPFTCVMHLPKDLVDRLAAILNVTTMTRDEMSLVNAIRSLVSCETGFITINRMGRLVGPSGQGANIAQNAALSVLDGHKSVSLAEITDVLSNTLGAARAASVLDMTQSFNFFGIDLLSTPKFWNAAIIISLLTFIFAAGGMVLSNMINKEMTPQATGCSPNLMAVGMGGMSFFISLSVPAALALYWGANSAIAPLQTWVIKKYFGPDRINAMDEARRLARMKQNEKALYDDVTGEKGKLALSPDPLPEIEDRTGGKKKKNNKK